MSLAVLGIVGLIVLFFIAIIGKGNRRRRITLQTVDWARIPSLLKGRKHFRSYHRSHLVRFDTFNTNNELSTRVIVEANDQTKDDRLLNKPLTKDSTEQITQILTPNRPQLDLRGEIFVATQGCRMIYTQDGIETDVTYLQSLLDVLVDLTEAYPFMVALGSEAIEFLISVDPKESHILYLIAPQLLRDIELDTRKRLGSDPSNHLCTRCLIRCAAHRTKIRLSEWGYVRYYGCRACGQSRDVVEWKEQIVAVLDRDMTKKYMVKDRAIWGNWFAHQALFDFGEVKIIKATDEDVERFSVQVGNDTDKIRNSIYKQMRCTVLPSCELSANTMRVLQSIFGQVEVRESI